MARLTRRLRSPRCRSRRRRAASSAVSRLAPHDPYLRSPCRGSRDRKGSPTQRAIGYHSEVRASVRCRRRGLLARAQPPAHRERPFIEVGRRPGDEGPRRARRARAARAASPARAGASRGAARPYHSLVVRRLEHLRRRAAHHHLAANHLRALELELAEVLPDPLGGEPNGRPLIPYWLCDRSCGLSPGARPGCRQLPTLSWVARGSQPSESSRSLPR